MATVVIFDEGKVTVSDTGAGTAATYNPKSGTTPIYVAQLNAPAPTDAKVGDRIQGADGNMYTVVAHKPSALESMLNRVIGVNEVADKPPASTGGRETRVRVMLGATGEYNYPFPTGRTVYELVRPAIAAAYAGHWNGAKGKVRVELAGDPGGAVNGGASLAANGTVIDGTIMEGNLDSYRKEVEVTGRLDVNLRLDGGAPTVLLVVTPL